MNKTKLTVFASLFVVVVTALLIEIASRVLFAVILHDADILWYPFLERRSHAFTYNNFSPIGSLQPQVEGEGYLKYRPGTSKKIYVLNENGDLYPYFTPINGLGFRGPEIAPVKEKGIFRIVCLGESSTFGAYNRDDTTWPAALGTVLNAADSPYDFEVINMGVSESTTDSLVPIIRGEVLPLNPDLVLFYGGNNDVSQYLFGRKNQIKLNRSYSFLVEILRANYYRSFYHSALTDPNIAERVFSGTPAILKQVGDNVRRAEELLHANNIHFIIILQSLAPEPGSESRFSNYKEYYKYLTATKMRGEFDFNMANNIALIHHQVMSYLSSEFSLVIDGSEAIFNYQSYFVSHVHLNPAGNRSLGEFVAAQVLRLVETSGAY